MEGAWGAEFCELKPQPGEGLTHQRIARVGAHGNRGQHEIGVCDGRKVLG